MRHFWPLDKLSAGKGPKNLSREAPAKLLCAKRPLRNRGFLSGCLAYRSWSGALRDKVFNPFGIWSNCSYPSTAEFKPPTVGRWEIKPPGRQSSPVSVVRDEWLKIWIPKCNRDQILGTVTAIQVMSPEANRRHTLRQVVSQLGYLRRLWPSPRLGS